MLREAEAKVGGAPNASEEVVELLLPGVVLVGEKIADFFTQDSPLQPHHLAPCFQHFSFFLPPNSGYFVLFLDNDNDDCNDKYDDNDDKND